MNSSYVCCGNRVIFRGLPKVLPVLFLEVPDSGNQLWPRCSANIPPCACPPAGLHIVGYRLRKSCSFHHLTVARPSDYMCTTSKIEGYVPRWQFSSVAVIHYPLYYLQSTLELQHGTETRFRTLSFTFAGGCDRSRLWLGRWRAGGEANGTLMVKLKGWPGDSKLTWSETRRIR